MHRQFLNALWGGIDDGWILLWFHDGDKIKESFWFRTADEAAAFVETVKDRRVNVYVGVGLSPKAYERYERCLKADIAGIGGLWLDIDVRCAEHKKPNLPDTIEDACSLFDTLPDGMKPTIVVDSGHGLQAWWLFREPWMFDSVTERADAEQLERRFIAFFKTHAKTRGWDIDSVHNLDRVMRVPGTTNVKGKPVPVTMLECDETVRYNPSDFEWLPELKHTTELAPDAMTLVLDPKADPPFERFNALVDDEPKFKASWEKQRKEFQDQSASSYDMSLARYAYMYGWNDQEVCNLIIAFRRKHGDDLKLRQDYYQRTLTAAKRGVENQQAITAITERVDTPDAPSGGLEGNEKESALQNLSNAFGITIVQIVKFVADPPVYKLKTARGDITLGEVDNLIKQDRFRTNLAAATGKYLPRFKGPVWDKIAQLLLDCCYDVAIGDEATEAGEMVSWLFAYLDGNKPFDETEMEEAIRNQAPVRCFNHDTNEERVAIFGTNLRRWLRVTQQEKINAKRMGVLLRAVGCVPDKLPVDSTDGKRSSRAVWYVPQKMTGED